MGGGSVILSLQTTTHKLLFRNEGILADTVKPQIDNVNDTVFSFIKQDNKITAKEMSERLKMSLSTVRRKIKELRDNGKIERIGSDKTGHWKIIE